MTKASLETARIASASHSLPRVLPLVGALAAILSFPTACTHRPQPGAATMSASSTAPPPRPLPRPPSDRTEVVMPLLRSLKAHDKAVYSVSASSADADVRRPGSQSG